MSQAAERRAEQDEIERELSQPVRGGTEPLYNGPDRCHDHHGHEFSMLGSDGLVRCFHCCRVPGQTVDEYNAILWADYQRQMLALAEDAVARARRNAQARREQEADRPILVGQREPF